MYAQAAASLAYIQQITCVTCQLVYFTFTVGRDVVVSGRFNHVGYGVAAFICYSVICASEYVSNLAYLRGKVCECCPFLVFAVVWYGVLFCVLSDVLVYLFLWVGSRFVGRFEGLLTNQTSTTKKRMVNNPSHRPTKRLPTHSNK